MPRRSYSALLRLLGATVAVSVAGCAPLSLGTSVAEPPPPLVVVPDAPVWVAPDAAPATPSDGESLERLVQFGDIWQTVRWFHPDVVGRASAWDTAYLRHVEGARASTDAASFVEAVHGLLSELGDPATRVVAASPVTSLLAGVMASVVWQTEDSVQIARPVSFATARELGLQQRRLPGALQTSVPRQVAVLDLRVDSGGSGNTAWWTRAPDMTELPVRGSLDAPARRRVRRSGPPAVTLPGATVASRACCTQWSLTSGPSLTAADSLEVPAAALVVIVNDATVVPAALFAMHAEGKVAFLSTESGRLQADAAILAVPLPGGVQAHLRMEELLLADGRTVATRADQVVPAPRLADALEPDTSDAVMQAALTLARSMARDEDSGVPRASAPRRLTVSDPAVVFTPDSINIYPSLPERLLATTKLWSAIRTFDPYVPVADESWDEKFRRALQDAESASSSRTYSAGLTRFVGMLDASQVDILAPDHAEFGRRRGAVPMQLRLVERRLLVTAIQDSAAERSGVRVGDEIVAIGGEPIENRLGRLRELISASNNWSREQRLERWLESGAALVKATYRVRSGTTDSRDVEFSYSEGAVPLNGRPVARRIDTLSAGVVRVRVDDAIGAWRDSVDRTPVASLPRDVTTAPAIIVDLRGVQSDVALRWLRGSPLDADARPFVREAHIELAAPPRGSLRTPELDPARQFTWVERVTPALDGTPFDAPMAILIDATTIGDGELLALRLAAGGSNRVLVGSATAGAVGRSATLVLPGSVRVSFPVSDVRRPDGRLVQRLGVPPDIFVSPTVTGVRAGRDEILEAAQRWISNQLAPPAPVRRR